ncbi:MAG TPA: ABC transporter ATP-binding protein [Verrucomicrobiae bacterium]|nr:ABC transporter ATP-binding protein [Verrucomicrobiae bacterium]
MTATIQTHELTRHYRKLRALDHLNLEVPEGAVYALVGPNGAGKTTSIKILMNLIGATSGRASVLGMDSKLIRGKAYTQIGYVSENQEFPEWMKVGALLAYVRKFYPTWDRDLERALVKQFELFPDRKIKTLSRGMKMKLALASALAFHPKLIILDEPFGGLDPLVRDQLIEGLLELAGEATVFLSSHDLAEIESFASHIGYLEEGRLRFSEEMTSLCMRFREVELTFHSDRSVPASVPASWRQVKAAGATVRFVESQFDEARTTAEVLRVFGDTKETVFRPMGLRGIFLALARKEGEA